AAAVPVPLLPGGSAPACPASTRSRGGAPCTRAAGRGPCPTTRTLRRTPPGPPGGALRIWTRARAPGAAPWARPRAPPPAPAPRAPLPDPQRVGVANGETVEVTMEDGTRLVGWFLKPDRINLRQPPPTSPTSPGLLWFYGNGETIAAIWPIVREFQPPGTAVLVVDYPGYGGSAGRANEAGLYAAADAAYAALVG